MKKKKRRRPELSRKINFHSEKPKLPFEINMESTKDLLKCKWDKNPKEHNDRNINELSEIIKANDFIDPIVKDQEGIIRRGHGSLDAAVKANISHIPVITYSFRDEAHKITYAISQNKSSELSKWKPLILQELFRKKELLKVEPDTLGFKESEINFYTEHAHKDGIKGKGSEISKEILSKYKIYKDTLCILGNHRLLCGDSTSKKDVERLMNNQKADLLITDPPYGVEYCDQTVGSRRIEGKPYLEERYKKMTGDTKDCKIYFDFLPNLKNIMKKDWAGYLFFADKRAELIYRAVRENNILIGQTLIWKKHILPSYRKYLQNHECFLFIGYSSNVKPTGKWYGKTNASTIWEIPTQVYKDVHSSTKPIELINRMLFDMSKKGDLIIDLFLGSGTTLISCEENNRRCFGLEIEPDYCKLIVHRWEQYTKKKARILL